MNKVILMGRLARDPEIRYSQGGQQTAICRYTLAVTRSYKRDGEPDADFIDVVAFANRGEFANRYFKKGMMVAVVGELRVSSYDDRDGNRRWRTEVIVSEQHFAESRASFEGRAQGADFAPAPSYGQEAGGRNSSHGGRSNYNSQQSQVPSYDQAPPSGNDGFMPIDEEIEGDEDLPF